MPRPAKKTTWPCGGCQASCTKAQDSIFCIGCAKWFHRTCQHLSKTQFDELRCMEHEFWCKGCCYSQGSFNFSLSLERLRKFASDEDLSRLKTAAQLESILLRDCQLETPDTCISWPLQHLQVDHVVHKIYTTCSNGKDSNKKPIAVSGDGSCLFNAVSVTLYANDRRAKELRVHTTIELLLHSDAYLQKYSPFSNFCCIEESIRDGAKGNDSSAFTMAALSTVIQHPIASVYPPMNGLSDPVFRSLTTTLEPLRNSSHSDTIYIMWSRIESDSPKTWWSPNHFVTLVTQADSTKSPIDIDTTDTSPPGLNLSASMVDEFTAVR